MTAAGDVPAVPTDPAERTAAFIGFLARCGAVRFGDFVGKSGRRMPYFVDLGQVHTGRHLAILGRFYAATIDQRFGDDVDIIFGPAYKGIPLAVATATALADDHGRDVGVCFDRKEAKDHGEGGNLIGQRPTDGDRIVIVEDVTTAGTSVRATVPALQRLGDVEVVGLVVGVDRRERGTTDEAALDELARAYALTTVALATIDDIVAELRDHDVDGRRLLDDADLERIATYRAAHGPVEPAP